MYNESGVIIADIKRYKETATDEELETLFSNVIIPNRVYYIETLSIEYYDSDDRIKYKISVHGYFHYNNVIQSYSFDEEIVSLSEWIGDKNFVFLADGVGSGFESHDIGTIDGRLNVSFWHHGDNYFIYNQEEMDAYIAEQSNGGIKCEHSDVRFISFLIYTFKAFKKSARIYRQKIKYKR